MAKSDPRVDAYIARSAEFAKPILSYFRDLVHSAVPDVEETMQWGAPHFDYKGMMLGIAAFKDHCAAHFWKGSLIGVDGYGDIKSVSDLPQKGARGSHQEAGATQRRGSESRSSEARDEERSEDAARSRRGAEEEQESGVNVRELLAKSPPRVHRIDHRCEKRRDATAPNQSRDRLDCRGQAEELEVHEEVKRRNFRNSGACAGKPL